MKKIVLASNNKHKLIEVKEILNPLGFECLSLSDIGFNEEIIEDGLTFSENAMIKAKAVRKVTNLPVIADDSGLSVDILNGEPGVHSHRYSGEAATDKENRDKLISVLSKLLPPYKAHFTSSIAYIDDKRSFVKEGYVYGEIILEEKGNNGFGYDPIFYLEEYKKTMAEVDPSIKNSISHRHNALMEFVKELLNEDSSVL